MRLYKHAREQPTPHNDVAGRGIMHLHSHMLPREARCLRNQVICMIAEYHLTSSAQVLSSLCPILLEAAKPLLPPIKSYVPGVAFEGTWDVRVLDRAKTLTWPPRLWRPCGTALVHSSSHSWLQRRATSPFGRLSTGSSMKTGVMLSAAWTTLVHAVLRFTRS